MEKEIFSLQTVAYIVCNTSFVLCNILGKDWWFKNVQNCRKLRKTTRIIKGLENFQNKVKLKMFAILGNRQEYLKHD